MLLLFSRPDYFLKPQKLSSDLVSTSGMQFDAKVNGHGDVGLIGTTAGGEWYYEQTFNRETWRVKQRFQSLKAVNGGAFGTVWLVDIKLLLI